MATYQHGVYNQEQATSLTTHTYLAPYIPAEKIVNIREYDTAALEAALTGGGE